MSKTRDYLIAEIPTALPTTLDHVNLEVKS